MEYRDEEIELSLSLNRYDFEFWVELFSVWFKLIWLLHLCVIFILVRFAIVYHSHISYLWSCVLILFAFFCFCTYTRSPTNTFGLVFYILKYSGKQNNSIGVHSLYHVGILWENKTTLIIPIIQ